MNLETRKAFSVKGLCPAVASDLARLARGSGLSVAALIREALTAYTRAVVESGTSAGNSLGNAAGTPSTQARNPTAAGTRNVAIEPAAIASRLRHAHAVLMRRANGHDCAGSANNSTCQGRRGRIPEHSRED